MLNLTALRRSARRLFDIHEYDKDLPQKLRSTFLKMEQIKDQTFRAEHLLKGRESLPYIYGGHVVALSLKAACQTVSQAKDPHSFHSYFIKAGSVEQPVDFEVEIVREGKSFATRHVKAKQNNELLFSMDISFHIDEKDSIVHAPSLTIPDAKPDELKSARQLILDQDKKLSISAKTFLGFKLAQFPPTFHGLFEMKPINQKIYEMHPEKPLQDADFTLWVKPQVIIGEDAALQRYFAAYLSDGSLVETALLPHISKGYIPDQVFSLDHCLWFHQTKFSMDDWMLWEQKSDWAGLFQEIDEDDVLSHGPIQFNKESIVVGEENEIGYLEPYLFMYHGCKQNWHDLRVKMPKAPYMENYYRMTVDLDKDIFDIVGPSDKPLAKLG